MTNSPVKWPNLRLCVESCKWHLFIKLHHIPLWSISALHSRYITFHFTRDKYLKYQIQKTELVSLGLYSFDNRLDSETDTVRYLLTDHNLHSLRMPKVCCQVGHAHFYVLFIAYISKAQNSPNLPSELKYLSLSFNKSKIYTPQQLLTAGHRPKQIKHFLRKLFYIFLVAIFSTLKIS